jgi:hypothetical protein
MPRPPVLLVDAAPRRKSAFGGVVALELCFARNGAYAREPGQLAPGILDEMPIDPFCGEPFRCELVDTLTYKLYSVGENRTDDGGRDWSDVGAGDGDIVFSTVK